MDLRIGRRLEAYIYIISGLDYNISCPSLFLMISGLDCICYCALFVLLLFIYRCKYFTNEFMLWPIVLGTNHYLFCEKEVIFKENILSFVLRKHKCNASICPLFSYMHFVKFEEKDIFHNNFNKKKKKFQTKYPIKQENGWFHYINWDSLWSVCSCTIYRDDFFPFI